MKKKTVTKGALKIVEADFSLQDKIDEMFSTARRLKDVHGETLTRNFEDDKPERVCAYILEHGGTQISRILTALPAEYKQQVEQALLAAVNAGQALEAMDIHGKHGSKIETSKNLKVTGPSVSDDQIREAVQLYAKRAEQAEHLGIDVRQLIRRLKELGLTKK